MPRYDPADVKSRARGRWAAILSAVAGLPVEALDGDHHPCPKCGGADRFRFTDRDGDGSLICNACARRQCGDGIGAVQWALGCDFQTALARVAEFVGAVAAPSPTTAGRNGRQATGRQGRQDADPGKDLQTMPWSEPLAGLWAARKPPIRPAAILAAGGRLARYRRQFTVVDLPVRGPDGAPVGHVIYNVTGGTLPKCDRAGKIVGQLKLKNTWGTAPGLIGRLPAAGGAPGVLWKVEGPSDALALLSCQDLPADVAVVANAMGAGEKPSAWMLELAAGRQVYVVGDADRPGDEGAATWAAGFACHAAEARQVRLPLPVTEAHGQDLRDWLASGHGYAELLELASGSPVVEAADVDDGDRGVLEADDDPHRLARINLENYRKTGRNLVNYKGDFLAWKRGCYRPLESEELRYKLTAAIKAEFDRLNLDAQARFQSGKDAGIIKADEAPPKAHRVTPACVTSVMQATASLTLVSSSIDQPAWLGADAPFPAREVIATENGIIHIPSLISGAPSFTEPTPDFFSRNCLPYVFDADAECPLWEATLQQFWPDDDSSVRTLQEWFGYCLTPDTSQHKLLMMVGPPRSGKGTVAHVLQHMIGKQNMASPKLASLAGPFGLQPLIGKLVALIADARLSHRADGVAVVENLLSISGEDPQDIHRKSITTLTGETLPIRFVIMTNELPNMHDASGAMMTRVLLLKMSKSFLGFEDRTLKARLLKELPGILNWAIRGWASLTARGYFLQPDSGQELIDDFQDMASPVKAFVRDKCILGPEFEISVDELYELWNEWQHENGRERTGRKEIFIRDLVSAFHGLKKKQARMGMMRERRYVGIGKRIQETENPENQNQKNAIQTSIKYSGPF